VDQSIIVASISLAASVITITLSFLFTKLHQFKMEERRIKEEHYKTFIKSVSDLALDSGNDIVQRKFADTINSILMIGNSEVIRQLMDFHDFVKIDSAEKKQEVETREWKIKYNIELTKIVKTMRKDLFGKNYNDNKIFPKVIHLAGFKPKRKRGY
jgi:hypothetical protein